MIKAKISSQYLASAFFLIAGINAFMLGGTWLFSIYYRDNLLGDWNTGSAIKYVLVQFNLATENVLASWYSSMLLLLVAIMSLICFSADRKRFAHKNGWLNGGWLFFSLIFALLSLDEIGSLHERVGQIASFNPFGGYALGWVYVLAIPIATVSSCMLIFSWIRLRKHWLSLIFLLLGMASFISIPFQEHIETAMKIAAGEGWHRPIFLTLLEEGAELFGSLCFLIATTLYGSWSGKKTDILSLSDIKLELSYSQKKSLVYGIAAIVCVGIVMILLDLTIAQAEGDTGIAKNWFPSAAAFLSALICFYRSSKQSKIGRYQKSTYFLMGFVSLIFSAYYGSGLYLYTLWSSTFTSQLILGFSIAVTTATTAMFFLRAKIVGWQSWAIALAWLTLLGLAFSFGKFYAPQLSYLAFSSLLLFLCNYAPNLKPVPVLSPLVKRY
ncbi:hypothetical protein [Sphaerothrix gracilis]|uniref:hypothetical protein n=1 Tax=Sphaerothrix gracilis TaxID=3151835 RepID=UPI0031FD7EB5